MEKIKTASPSQLETEGISLKENLENRHNSKNWAKPNRHSIRKNWAILIGVVILVAVVTGCKKEDKTDPKGTVLVAMREGSSTTYVKPDGSNIDLYIYNDNFYDSYGYTKFATIGKVSGLGSIKQIPTSGYAKPPVAVTPGYGYVAKCEETTYNPSTGRNDLVEKTTYLRIYVVDYIYSAGSGGVIGANVKYQYPFNP